MRRFSRFPTGNFAGPLGLAIALACAPPARAQDAPAADSLATTPAPPAANASDSAFAAASMMSAPRGTAIRKVRLVGRSQIVMRSGPGDDFAIAGVFKSGASFPVIAKREDWYNVQLSPTETGWVHAALCKEFDDFSDLEFKPNPKLYSRTGAVVLTAYTGAYAFDRKSNSLVLGGRVGYYVFDRLQFEGTLAWTHVNRPAEIVETLFGLTLEEEDFDMLFYNLNLTWELLPGRQMVPYLSGGVGSSIMQGSSEAAVNFGGGVSLFLSKRTAVRWEVRDYRFETGADNARRENNNIEFTLGTSFLF
jgi:outer membrane beta-barrel protein